MTLLQKHLVFIPLFLVAMVGLLREVSVHEVLILNTHKVIVSVNSIYRFDADFFCASLQKSILILIWYHSTSFAVLWNAFIGREMCGLIHSR